MFKKEVVKMKKLSLGILLLFVVFSICPMFTSFVRAVEPEISNTNEETEEEVTPEDIGIDENGEAPMILTDPNGEPLSDQFQVVGDGVDEKYRIAEDSTNVNITEHSVIYNTGAMSSAGMETGEPDIQWTVTDQNTGETTDGGSGSTEYSGVFKTPGFYNLGNSGSTPVDSSTVVTEGSTENTNPEAVESGTDVELEVADITAPSMKVVVTPEDNHAPNVFFIREDPDNLDAYPITNKTAKVSVNGPNWSKAGASGGGNNTEVDFVTNFGMVSEENLPNVNDSKLNPDIQALNDYTVNSDLDSALGEGLYVPVSVRTNFEIFTEEDIDIKGQDTSESVNPKVMPEANDPREERKLQIKKSWKLIVEIDGETRVIKETPNFIFRIPNLDVINGPKYTLVAESTDGTGNAITCNIPIIVMPKDLDVRVIENKSSRLD